MRAFVAIPLPEEVRNFYSRICRDMRKGAVMNVARPDKLHITLSFFNHLKDEEIEKVRNAIETLKLKPIEIRCSGIGMFKRRGIPAIIYIETKSDTLSSFTAALRKNLKKYNINFDDKPFKSHITIARVKEIIDLPLFEKMYRKSSSDFKKQEFFAPSITLYSSDMLTYKEVFKIELENSIIE